MSFEEHAFSKGEMFYNKGHQVVESGLKFHMVGEKWFPVPPVPLSAQPPV